MSCKISSVSLDQYQTRQIDRIVVPVFLHIRLKCQAQIEAQAVDKKARARYFIKDPWFYSPPS